jgi:hypothetical protein
MGILSYKFIYLVHYTETFGRFILATFPVYKVNQYFMISLTHSTFHKIFTCSDCVESLNHGLHK